MLVNVISLLMLYVLKQNLLSSIAEQEYFNYDYEKFCIELDKYDDGNYVFDNSPFHEILNSNITIQEIDKAVKSLKANKAPGIDLI